MKVYMKKFSEYICRQLKHHQHSARGKTSTSLDIILNVFKCLAVSLVPLKFLLWQMHYFFLFISVDTLCKFTMMLGVYTLLFPQEELHFFPEGKGCTHLAAHSSKRVKPLSDEAAHLRHSSRSYPFNLFNRCLPKILLGPFLNTLSHL